MIYSDASLTIHVVVAHNDYTYLSVSERDMLAYMYTFTVKFLTSSYIT